MLLTYGLGQVQLDSLGTEPVINSCLMCKGDASTNVCHAPAAAQTFRGAYLATLFPSL